MVGRGIESPSDNPRQATNSPIPGIAQLTARRNASTSTANPSGTPATATSAGPPQRTTPNISSPMASAIQIAWRNSGAISARRPAPSSCATDGGTAYMMPIIVISGIDARFAPIATAPSTCASRWPASITSITPCPIAESCATISGSARRSVALSSRRRSDPMTTRRNMTPRVAAVPSHKRPVGTGRAA